MSSSIAKRTRFIANVGGSTLRPRDELYMLFVAVDIDNGTFEPVWLVPSLDFVKKTKPNHRNRSSGSAMRETASPGLSSRRGLETMPRSSLTSRFAKPK
jgi:hypothetical protein